jgi:hypothetical protein
MMVGFSVHDIALSTIVLGSMPDLIKVLGLVGFH